MSRKDRRTEETASPLVAAIEQFLNNFPTYIQDKRKIVPDIKHVIDRIKDTSARTAYAARLAARANDVLERPVRPDTG